METIELGSKTELHHDWQIKPIGMVDIKELNNEYFRDDQRRN